PINLLDGMARLKSCPDTTQNPHDNSSMTRWPDDSMTQFFYIPGFLRDLRETFVSFVVRFCKFFRAIIDPRSMPTLTDISAQVKQLAVDCDFDAAGIAGVRAQDFPELAYFEQWIERGHAG